MSVIWLISVTHISQCLSFLFCSPLCVSSGPRCPTYHCCVCRVRVYLWTASGCHFVSFFFFNIYWQKLVYARTCCDTKYCRSEKGDRGHSRDKMCLCIASCPPIKSFVFTSVLSNTSLPSHYFYVG